jgi:hypothetical protein
VTAALLSLGLAAWGAMAVLAALCIGRMIRRRDEQVPRGHGRTPERQLRRVEPDTRWSRRRPVGAGDELAVDVHQPGREVLLDPLDREASSE